MDDLCISQYWKLKPIAPPLWVNIEQNRGNTVIDGDSYFLLSLTYGELNKLMLYTTV